MPCRKPTWALLPPSGLLPAEDAPLYLGRLVADIDYPSSDYCPEDPRTALYSNNASSSSEPVGSKNLPRIIEVVDTDASIFLSLHHSTKVHAQLTKILGGGHEKELSTDKSVSSQRVITRLLPQYRKAFKAITANYQEEILELLEANGGRGYFIVGVKTCIDAQVSDRTDQQTNSDAELKMPVQEIIAASGGIPLIAGDAVDISGNLDLETKTELLTRFVAVGERIFSLQFRTVRGKNWLHEQATVKGFYHPDETRGTFTNDAEPIESLANESMLDDDDDDGDIEVGDEIEVVYEDLRSVAKQLVIA